MIEPLKIHAQNADFWVFEKAAGVSFHSEQQAGLVVLAEKLVGEKLYPVHRLDKVTSGLILLARHRQAAAELTELFAQRQIQKFYLALSTVKPQKKQGWVKGEMIPSRRGAWRLTPEMDKPAVTYFYSQGYQNAGFRAFLLKPYTGKTHQLRVALKSISAPILGDVLYGAVAADRVYLHAYTLCFDLFGQHHRYQCFPQRGEVFSKLLALGLPDSWSEPEKMPWPQLIYSHDNGLEQDE